MSDLDRRARVAMLTPLLDRLLRNSAHLPTWQERTDLPEFHDLHRAVVSCGLSEERK